jgi:hypothetical protein
MQVTDSNVIKPVHVLHFLAALLVPVKHILMFNYCKTSYFAVNNKLDRGSGFAESVINEVLQIYEYLYLCM